MRVVVDVPLDEVLGALVPHAQLQAPVVAAPELEDAHAGPELAEPDGIHSLEVVPHGAELRQAGHRGRWAVA